MTVHIPPRCIFQHSLAYKTVSKCSLRCTVRQYGVIETGEGKANCYLVCHGGAMSNWYAIQVNTGKEKSIREQLLHLFSLQDALLKVLIPTCSTRFKLQGQRIEKRSILFPGYVFLVTDDIDSILKQKKQVIGMVKILKHENDILPITDDEQATIERLINSEANMDISLGVIEGGKVIIMEGPLKGLESQIVRIDRHKRLAWISLKMFGRDMITRIGLEIVKKA